uniref:DM2 domain-containing protein n=1 Tax=Aotus nancymaae TaxID=37293 RepID=A0A2K5E3B1_AOTNA
MVAWPGFQSVAPSGGAAASGGAGAAAALGPGGTPGPPVRMGPAPGQGLYRSPMSGAASPRPGMLPGSRMTPQGPSMGPPGYGGTLLLTPSVLPGLVQSGMDQSRKRPAPQQIPQVQQQAVQNRNHNAKKKKMADKILPQTIRELVPESQTIMRKWLGSQEALKHPIKQKRKLQIFISNIFNPAKSDAEDLLEDSALSKYDATKQKRKFSSFFKSLVIELDKDLYGPDNHLVEWHRTETDGFQVKRPGDVNPPQFKLDPRLAQLLGIHTQTHPVIIQALWQYIKTHKLQDPHEHEFVTCDKYLQQIFESQQPIIINHVISVDPNDQKKTACYDIDVEVDDILKTQMNSFLLSTASQQEICRDLKTMTDVVGNPEEERRTEFYFQPWAQEAVCRYFYSKQALGIRNTQGLSHSPDLAARILDLGPVLPASWHLPWSCLGRSRGCRWFKDNIRMKRVSHFCLIRHLLSSSLTPSLPTPSFPLPHKVPMCLSPPLVYIRPLDSVKRENL